MKYPANSQIRHDLRDLVESAPEQHVVLFDISELRLQLWIHACALAGDSVTHSDEIKALDALLEKMIYTLLKHDTCMQDLTALIKSELTDLIGHNQIDPRQIADIFVTKFAEHLYRHMGPGVIPQQFVSCKIHGSTLILGCA